MAQPENLKEMVTLIIRKSDYFYPCKRQAHFFCFMHSCFTSRLAFVKCPSHIQTLIALVNLHLIEDKLKNNPLTGSFCKLNLKQ